MFLFIGGLVYKMDYKAGANHPKLSRCHSAKYTTPPANLDAACNAGYINIVLKQNENFGTNGSYTATAGYGRGAPTAAGFTINHCSKKANIDGDLSFAQARTKPFFFDNTITNNGMITQLSGNTDMKSKRTNFDGRLATC